jgi:hypothetical protein
MKRSILPTLLATLIFGHVAFAQYAQTPAPTTPTESTALPPSAWPAEPAPPRACDNCVCGPDGHVWAEAEYLLWWVRGTALPPLVTTSPAGTPQSQAGVLGTPGVAVLFGGNLALGAARSGGRFTLGAWLDPEQTVGVEASYFGLEAKTNRFVGSSAGSTILGRPFTNAITGAPDSELVSFPGVASGTIAATSTSSIFESVEVLGRLNLCCSCNYRVDLLAGYRFLHFQDQLGVDEALVAAANPAIGVAAGTTIHIADRFNASNELNAFDLGVAGEMRRGSWAFGWVAKVALGSNHETVDINGQTVTSVPGAPPPVTSTGGFFALGSNIGHFERDRFTFVPELDLKVSYQLRPAVRLSAGYTFLYWDNVVRAANQIDTVINPNLLPPPISPLPGPVRPAPRFDSTNIWVQGISLGLEVRF